MRYGGGVFRSCPHTDGHARNIVPELTQATHIAVPDSVTLYISIIAGGSLESTPSNYTIV
jgi:hypothetical protein